MIVDHWLEWSRLRGPYVSCAHLVLRIDRPNLELHVCHVRKICRSTFATDHGAYDVILLLPYSRFVTVLLHYYDVKDLYRSLGEYRLVFGAHFAIEVSLCLRTVKTYRDWSTLTWCCLLKLIGSYQEQEQFSVAVAAVAAVDPSIVAITTTSSSNSDSSNFQ